MPGQAQQALRSFNNVVGSSFFPRYLEPFARERIVSVPRAERRVLRDPEIRAAANSVFKVRSNNRCGSGVEGTGFLYAPEKLMTNAHVVAGVTEPMVQVGEKSIRGTVVYYNPDVDIAVIDVPGLDGPTIRFDLAGKENQQGAALGFPQDGPFNAQPVRIRGDQRLRSPDIYGNGTVTRHVFSLRGLIRPGNSGGPVVSTQGRVLGVVFAASVSDRDTGYALTADQVRRAAAVGLTSEQKVSSGNCA
jgi:S1-C subfamily serine protease